MVDPNLSCLRSGQKEHGTKPCGIVSGRLLEEPISRSLFWRIEDTAKGSARSPESVNIFTCPSDPGTGVALLSP